ncbi:MAG: hypothetical protein ACI860_001674, partial [Chitinophagales bacterium]
PRYIRAKWVKIENQSKAKTLVTMEQNVGN